MGNQVVAAVLICLLSLFATTLTMFVVGEVVDRYQDKLANVDVDYGDVKFPHMASAVNNMFNWIFSIPVFLTYVWIIWMFKVVIQEHKYTREEEQYGY